MRFSILALALVLGTIATDAVAMPIAHMQPNESVRLVQLQCNPSRCIDPQTGIYTESTCDRYGCRQSSGPVGRVGGGRGGYGGGYEDDYDRRPRRRDWNDGYGRGDGGGFDCNRSRCIDASGRVWESTCDRYGCRPLRPARGRRW